MTRRLNKGNQSIFLKCVSFFLRYRIVYKDFSLQTSNFKAATDDIVLISVAVRIVSVLDSYSCKILQPYVAVTVRMHSSVVSVLSSAVSGSSQIETAIKL